MSGTKSLVVGSLRGLGHIRGRTRVAAIVVVGRLGAQDNNHLLNEQEAFQHFHNWCGTISSSCGGEQNSKPRERSTPF